MVRLRWIGPALARLQVWVGERGGGEEGEGEGEGEMGKVHLCGWEVAVVRLSWYRRLWEQGGEAVCLQSARKGVRNANDVEEVACVGVVGRYMWSKGIISR